MQIPKEIIYYHIIPEMIEICIRDMGCGFDDAFYKSEKLRILESFGIDGDEVDIILREKYKTLVLGKIAHDLIHMNERFYICEVLQEYLRMSMLEIVKALKKITNERLNSMQSAIMNEVPPTNNENQAKPYDINLAIWHENTIHLSKYNNKSPWFRRNDPLAKNPNPNLSSPWNKSRLLAETTQAYIDRKSKEIENHLKTKKRIDSYLDKIVHAKTTTKGYK